jgi:hypothetical protein
LHYVSITTSGWAMKASLKFRTWIAKLGRRLNSWSDVDRGSQYLSWSRKHRV